MTRFERSCVTSLPVRAGLADSAWYLPRKRRIAGCTHRHGMTVRRVGRARGRIEQQDPEEVLAAVGRTHAGEKMGRESRSNKPGFPRNSSRSRSSSTATRRGYHGSRGLEAWRGGTASAHLHGARSWISKPCISYEYSSLTQPHTSVASTTSMVADGPLWVQAHSGAPRLKNRPNAVETASRARQTVRVTRTSEREYELPSTHPIDRCSLRRRRPTARSTSSFGTNPEVVLLIESDGKNGAMPRARMTRAQCRGDARQCRCLGGSPTSRRTVMNSPAASPRDPPASRPAEADQTKKLTE